MNEKEIIKFVNYHGKYNKDVKSKFKLLLKKYHPDHNNGQDDTFKLINKLKKEIESGNYKYHDDEEVDIKDVNEVIDKDLLLREISELEAEKKYYVEKREKLNEELNILYEKYGRVFNLNIAHSIKETDSQGNVKSIKKKSNYVITLLAFTVTFFLILYLINHDIIYLILLLIFTIIYTILLIKFRNKLENAKLINKKIIYNDKKNKINYDELNNHINYFHEKLWKYDKKIINLDNNIRLYKNRLNHGKNKENI